MPRRLCQPAAPLALGLLALPLMMITGCVERIVTITSEPDGALVYLNDREVGRTPVQVEFVYYGTYDVRLVHEGYEPLLTTGEAKAPLWDLPGPDFLAEIAPMDLESEVHWHYVLPPEEMDPAALVDRAQAMRERAAAAEPTPRAVRALERMAPEAPEAPAAEAPE